MNSATSRRLTQMNEKIMPARGQTSVRHSKSKQPLSLSLSVLRPVSPSFEDLARVPTTDYSAGPGLGRGHHAAKGATHSVDFRRSLSRGRCTYDVCSGERGATQTWLKLIFSKLSLKNHHSFWARLNQSRSFYYKKIIFYEL